MRRLLRNVSRFTVSLAVLVLGSCSPYFLHNQRKAEYYAVSAGWDYRLVEVGPYAIVSALSPRRDASAPLAIYLEGDGMAYVAPTRPSADPTPDDPLALRLALAHSGGPAAYLARPCQYVMTSGCAVALWTSHRYSPQVLEAMGRAIDVLKSRAGATRLILVGYSGGGALAVLLAASRDDVAGLVTVAANLDLSLWTSLQGLTPLRGSLDPAAVAQKVASIPQVHFVGGRDRVVPPQVAEAFLDRSGDGDHSRLARTASFDHICCWVDAWPSLLGQAVLSAVPGWQSRSR